MEFQLIYDGEALNNHEIAPTDLSTALIAINDLLETADRVLNHGKTKTEVKVKASFETGCFKINFKSNQSFLEKTVEIFNGDHINASLNAIAIFAVVFSSTKGLVALLKFLKGSRATKIFENADGTFTVTKDEKELKVEKRVYKLYQDYKLRKAFEKLVEPLEKSGIDDLVIKEKNSKDFECQIDKNEKEYFKCPKAEEKQMSQPQTYITNIKIENFSFKEGNKWFVNDGGESFYVLVEHKEFLEKINRREQGFFNGDILEVRIRKIQYLNIDDGKLKSEFFVEEVLSCHSPKEIATLL